MTNMAPHPLLRSTLSPLRGARDLENLLPARGEKVVLSVAKDRMRGGS